MKYACFDRNVLYIVCNPLPFVYKRAKASTFHMLDLLDSTDMHIGIVTHAP
jgi:hypothetical protein